MYQSVPSITITPPQTNPGQIFKNHQILALWANSLCQIPGSRASQGPLILINFTLFHRIQNLNHLFIH